MPRLGRANIHLWREVNEEGGEMGKLLDRKEIIVPTYVYWRFA
jgi:hypothetical protein